MKTTFKIENLKCQGCVSTVTNGLLSLDGVVDVQVDLSTSVVQIVYSGDTDRTDEFAAKLKSLGYPKAGE
jgi:copper chaperone CopZ